MKVLNFGSLNVDHVYQLDHFVRPGETISCTSYKKFCGGKGLNQSVALAKAGAQVFHAGKIGPEGDFLRRFLDESGVDTTHIHDGTVPTGHAIIQVNSEGENSIVINAGANGAISPDEAQNIINNFGENDFLLIQNEISSIREIIEYASKRKMTVVFNPAPMTKDVTTYPLELIDIFVLNETEAHELTGRTEDANIIAYMKEKFPESATLYTYGKQGARYIDKNHDISANAIKVEPVDTTGAGDTFIGYFLATLIEDNDREKALHFAVAGASLSVVKHGAATSIPTSQETETFYNQNREEKKNETIRNK